MLRSDKTLQLIIPEQERKQKFCCLGSQMVLQRDDVDFSTNLGFFLTVLSLCRNGQAANCFIFLGGVLNTLFLLTHDRAE